MHVRTFSFYIRFSWVDIFINATDGSCFLKSKVLSVDKTDIETYNYKRR